MAADGMAKSKEHAASTRAVQDLAADMSSEFYARAYPRLGYHC